jgi:hypothetical protein
MKRYLVLLCAVTIGLGIVSEGQAQILRRRSGCGVSAGCNVGSGGCNVGSSRGCSISPAVPAAVVVPAQLPPTAFATTSASGAIGGQGVQRLFEQAAGCTGDSCPVEKTAPAQLSVPGPSDSTRNRVDVRSAMAFCAAPDPAAVERPAIAPETRWSSLVGAFR